MPKEKQSQSARSFCLSGPWKTMFSLFVTAYVSSDPEHSCNSRLSSEFKAPSSLKMTYSGLDRTPFVLHPPSLVDAARVRGQTYTWSFYFGSLKKLKVKEMIRLNKITCFRRPKKVQVSIEGSHVSTVIYVPVPTNELFSFLFFFYKNILKILKTILKIPNSIPSRPAHGCVSFCVQGFVRDLFRGAFCRAPRVPTGGGPLLPHSAESGHLPQSHPRELPQEKTQLYRWDPPGPFMKTPHSFSSSSTHIFLFNPFFLMLRHLSVHHQSWSPQQKNPAHRGGRLVGSRAAARSPTPRRAPPSVRATSSPSTEQVGTLQQVGEPQISSPLNDVPSCLSRCRRRGPSGGLGPGLLLISA